MTLTIIFIASQHADADAMSVKYIGTGSEWIGTSKGNRDGYSVRLSAKTVIEYG